MTEPNERIAQVESALTPRTPIAGQPALWTLEERMNAYAVPGVSVAVFRNGALDWVKGYGLCEAGKSDRPVTADTLFQAASMSKPVCAAAILQLVAEGLVDLDAPINDILQSWSLPENEYTRAAPVTLRRILSHTAGLNVHGFEGFAQGQDLPTILQVLTGEPPAKTPAIEAVITPGTASQYSGGGTMIAQLVVMEQRCAEFETALQDHILGPLGMTNSTFAQPLAQRFRPQAASGHRPDGGVLPGKWCNLPQLGAGGLWTTSADYARFLIALRAAWAGAPDAILPAGLARQMMQRQETGAFGLGPRLFGRGASLRFEHGGSQQGYQCESVCFLESGDGAVVLTNSENGSPLAFELLNAIARVHDWPGYLRSPRPSLSLTETELDAYTGVYRITYGLAAERIGIRREGVALYTMMDLVPDAPALLASRTELYSPQAPYDVRLEFGGDGRVQMLRVFEEDLLILEAVRDDRCPDWRPASHGG